MLDLVFEAFLNPLCLMLYDREMAKETEISVI